MATELNLRRISRRQFLQSTALLGLATAAAACAAPVAAPGAGGAAAPAQEGVQISWVTPAAVGLERTMYENFALKFENENPGISVALSFEAWNDYMTKLPTMLAGGVIPDVIHQHISIVQDYASRKALSVLNDLMDADGVRAEDYIPELFRVFSHQDNTYAIPKDSALRGVYYNKDMFDAAGVPYPTQEWTLDDFMNMALELTRDQDGRPASDPNFDAENIQQWGLAWTDTPAPDLNDTMYTYLRAFGGDWYDDDFTTTFINEDAVMENFEFFHTMRCIQHTIPAASQALGEGNPWRAGLTAMATDFHIMHFFATQENVEFQYDVTFTPVGPAGQFVGASASAWAIPVGATHKEEGWQYVRYLTSLPVQTFIGEQKRWGVSLKEAVSAIEPEDGNPEHFAMVHTDPIKGTSDVPLVSMKFPPKHSEIKQVYATEFDPIWNCASDDIEGAAQRTKEQVEAILASIEW
jgi:multiple sugar transport system substrate-binding protein